MTDGKTWGGGVRAPEDPESSRRAQRPVRVALALLILVVTALVAVGAVASYRIYTLANKRFISQAAPFFAVTEALSTEMLNQETGVRGYVITADPKTLQPYNQGKKLVKVELALIAKNSSIDPRVPGHLRAMRREVATLQAYFANEIALVKQGPAGQRRAQANVLAGKNHFDHLRQASGALISDAGEVIKRSHQEQRRTLITSFVVLGVAGFLAVAIAVGLLLFVPRQLLRLYREERLARREAEQGANASRALSHIREAVVLLGDDGAVRYWNPTADELFNHAAGADGSYVLAQTLAEFRDAGSNPGPRPVMLDGERWLICTESQFPGGRVAVFRDVSEDHRLEQLRSDFVATAAHELRTPLAAIYGAVRTLRQPKHEFPVEVREQFLEMIETEAERLKLVMDQLLVSAQLDREELHFDREPIDAAELCESIVDSVQLHRPQAIELTIQRPRANVLLEADAERLRQVIANLLDNAIKYSPGGGRVELRVVANGNSGMIEVADQGLGVPANEQRRIFEKFYRVDPSMSRGIGGSGLGLYISRELVQQMGGQLSLTSRLGQGSTFTITLPLAETRT